MDGSYQIVLLQEVVQLIKKVSKKNRTIEELINARTAPTSAMIMPLVSNAEFVSSTNLLGSAISVAMVYFQQEK